MTTGPLAKDPPRVIVFADRWTHVVVKGAPTSERADDLERLARDGAGTDTDVLLLDPTAVTSVVSRVFDVIRRIRQHAAER
jgi:hypothetical protein